MSGSPRSSRKRSGGSERALFSASAGGRYCRKGRAKVVRYCALHKLIHKGYHVRIAFSRAENYGYNAAYVLAEGDDGVAISKSTAAAHA
jgi:hypothetical protein